MVHTVSRHLQRLPLPFALSGWGLLAAAPVLLWWLGQLRAPALGTSGQFAFVHSCLELFAVVVALLVFTAGYQARFSRRQGTAMLFGAAFLGVALLDMLHLFSYVGMPDALSANTPHKSMLFWLLARTLAALALLAYAALPVLPEPGTRLRRLGLAVMVGLLGAAALTFLRRPDVVAALYREGEGVTRLKTGWEWVLVALGAATLAVLWLRRRQLAREGLAALAFAAALSAVSELFFMHLGQSDQDLSNLAGHGYKVAAYLFLFHATFHEAVQRPIQRLLLQHLREEVTLQSAPDAILWVDAHGFIVMANPATAALTGYAEHELVGENVDIFLPEPLRALHGKQLQSYFAAPHPRAMGKIDLTLLRKDGMQIPVDIALGHWESEDGKGHAIAYVRDLSERKRFEDSLRHQATHDEVTGLPNRWLLRLQLNRALARAQRGGGRVAVLFLDLDHFKGINDSLGHAAGDQLLAMVGMRLGAALRDNDLLARLGGDEFAILMDDFAQADVAIGVAAKLLAALHAPFQLLGKEVYAGGSLGLAFYPDDAADSDTLLRFADLAMYQAKQAGRGRYACYSRDMDRRAHEDMLLHTRLKSALAHGSLHLHYQPQVSMRDGTIVGAEALLRWHDDILGEVAPLRFIAIAESTGLIVPLSEWVLATACRQIAAWDRAGHALPVAVNLSALHFNRPDLVASIGAALAAAGAAAQLLELEITESAALLQPELARAHITALSAMGCRVALDDFGTGYSSLAYLKSLPVTVLKIDRSFVRDVLDDEGSRVITQAIIGLAHNLGMSLVAEGVETEAQRDFLQRQGCEVYQGWLFGKAMPAADLQDLLRMQAPQVAP